VPTPADRLRRPRDGSPPGSGHGRRAHRQQVRVAGLDDGDATQHLPNNDLDVLVVDAHTLRTVDLLDLLDEEAFGLTTTADAQHLLRIDSTDDELLAGLDVLAVLDEEAGALGD